MKTIRLLTIGNSFSQNALTYLEDMALGTDEVRFEVGRASLGGCSLEKHWNLAQYTAVHPEYRPYPDGSLQSILSAAPWDVVALQQVSRGSWLQESFEPYLSQLHALIRERAPQADVMLHQTWAYRTDSPFLTENCLTQTLMHERIEACYQHFSAKLRCGVLPSGRAIHLARQAPGRQFTWPEPDFDYQRAAAPDLPRQEHSFAAGWYWSIERTPDGIPQLLLDATHLNRRGCYLAGAVWFRVLTGLDIHISRFEPDDIPADDAAFLRQIAAQTPIG